MERETLPPSYTVGIRERNLWRYLKGLAARWLQFRRHEKARRIARKNGAVLGDDVVLPIELAREANANLRIGNHVSIQTSNIDMRSPVNIHDYVIIGAGTKIITTSHNIDKPELDLKHYGIEILEYVWLPTDVLVLPSCRLIGRGAVVGSGSVVVKNVEPMSVVGGNPAMEFKKRSCVHDQLVVESLLGGDYRAYRRARSG